MLSVWPLERKNNASYLFYVLHSHCYPFLCSPVNFLFALRFPPSGIT